MTIHAVALFKSRQREMLEATDVVGEEDPLPLEDCEEALFAIPGQSEIIGAPQNKKARVVRAKTEKKKCSLIL